MSILDKIEKLESDNLELKRKIECIAKYMDIDLILELQLESKRKVKRK